MAAAYGGVCQYGRDFRRGDGPCKEPDVSLHGRVANPADTWLDAWHHPRGGGGRHSAEALGQCIERGLVWNVCRGGGAGGEKGAAGVVRGHFGGGVKLCDLLRADIFGHLGGDVHHHLYGGGGRPGGGIVPGEGGGATMKKWSCSGRIGSRRYAIVQ